MVAAAVVGGAVIGGAVGIYGANKAAGAQVDAANTAAAADLAMYNQTRSDQAPYREAGYTALGQLKYGIGQPATPAAYGEFTRPLAAFKPFTKANYQADPGYQFRLDQGTKALERSAAARGGLLTGGMAKDLTDYSQGVASQEYGNAYNRYNNDQTTAFNQQQSDQTTRFNRLAALAGIGQTANSTLASVGQSTANNIGNNITSAGNATAAGYVGTANAINNAVGQGISSYQNNQLLSRIAPQSNYGYGSKATAGTASGNYYNDWSTAA